MEPSVAPVDVEQDVALRPVSRRMRKQRDPTRGRLVPPRIFPLVHPHLRLFRRQFLLTRIPHASTSASMSPETLSSGLRSLMRWLMSGRLRRTWERAGRREV